MSVLVFTDAHDNPGDNQDRFTALGKLILKYRPDNIVQLGDFLTMDSLSRWNVNKRLTMEGVRYHNDVDSANRAIHKILEPTNRYNAIQAKGKKAQYRPKWWWFEGNHEYWINQYLEQHPEMVGHVHLQTDLLLPQDAEWVPYPQYREIQGYYFTHAPQNKVGAISSRYVCDRALDHYSKSIIFGHTHRLLLSSTFRYGSTDTQFALSCGCFFEETPDYAEDQPNDYWRGVLYIRDSGGIELIPLEELKCCYG